MRWALVPAVIILALVAIGIAQTSVGREAATRFHLTTPGSESYTELYFNQPQMVAAATEGTAGISPTRSRVSFVIRDVEHRRVTYRWTVSSAGLVRAAGSVTLAPGQRALIARKVSTGCTPTRRTPVRARVVATLTDPGESISYWVRCHA